jgi:hypothetical protein
MIICIGRFNTDGKNVETLSPGVIFIILPVLLGQNPHDAFSVTNTFPELSTASQPRFVEPLL